MLASHPRSHILTRLLPHSFLCPRAQVVPTIAPNKAVHEGTETAQQPAVPIDECATIPIAMDEAADKPEGQAVAVVGDPRKHVHVHVPASVSVEVVDDLAVLKKALPKFPAVVNLEPVVLVAPSGEP